MDKRKQFAMILILAVAILASLLIIFPGTLSVLGMRTYQDNSEETNQTVSGPEQTAEAFYAWYLDSFGDPAAESFRSPDYHDSEYLTQSLIGHVDEVLASFEEMSGYDPFLCAQNLPPKVMADDAFFHGEQASVVMRTEFANLYFTVDLVQSDAGWQISNVTCAAAPDGVAKAFYTWYLGYIGDRASENFRNPMVDKAYQDSGFLTADFIEELDELTAEGMPADPILMAQDIPQDFSVDPGVEEGTAVVHLRFGSETVTHLKLSMVNELGQWKIDQIAQLDR